MFGLAHGMGRARPLRLSCSLVPNWVPAPPWPDRLVFCISFDRLLFRCTLHLCSCLGLASEHVCSEMAGNPETTKLPVQLVINPHIVGDQFALFPGQIPRARYA